MTDKPKTSTERSRALRERRREKGLVPVQGIYAPKNKKLLTRIRHLARQEVEAYLLSHGGAD